MPVLYAMCGLAFAGKSTIAGRLAEVVDAEVVDLDQILRERGHEPGRGLSIALWENASTRATGRLQSILDRGRDAILDDTCSRRSLRDRYRGVASTIGCAFRLIWVDTNIEQIVARMRENDIHRQRPPIGPDVFAVHRAGFEPPTGDETPVHLRNEEDVERWLRDLAR